MAKKNPASKQLLEENQDLRTRLEELEETLRAIQNGEVDALVVSGQQGGQVYTLKDESYPYRIIVENIDEGAVTLIADGTIVYGNTFFAEMVKSPLEKVINSSFHAYVSEKDRVQVREFIQHGLEGSSKRKCDLVATNGRLLTAYLSLTPVPIDGEPLISMTVTDLTKPERANRALRMLYECNQIIVHATDEQDLLDAICGKIVEVGGYRMAFVGFAEENEKKQIRPAAQAGYEEGYLETVNITWDDSELVEVRRAPPSAAGNPQSAGIS